MMINKIKKLAAVSTLILAMPIAAHAATVDFDGLSGGIATALGNDLVADDLRIVNGSCADLECMALNMNEGTEITSLTGPFTIESFWFQLLGSKSELTVTSSKSGSETFTVADYGSNNGGQTFSLVGNALFQDIDWIFFEDTSSNAGNIRIDDLEVLTPVPLPAGGLLLLSGFAIAAGYKRRNKASA